MSFNAYTQGRLTKEGDKDYFKSKDYFKFQKRETFSSLMTTKYSENLPGHSTERRAYWFVLKIAWVFPIPSGSVVI